MARQPDNTIAYVESLVAQLGTATHAATVDALCIAFAPLVKSLAQQYAQPVLGADREELEAEAAVAFLDACRRFDRTKGAFPSHAKRMVRNHLGRYVADLANPVKLLHDQMFLLGKMRRVGARLAQALLREPTVSELAAAMEIDEADVKAMLVYDEGPVRFDVQYASSEWGLEKYPAPSHTPEEQMLANEEADALEQFVAHEKERS